MGLGGLRQVLAAMMSGNCTVTQKCVDDHGEYYAALSPAFWLCPMPCSLTYPLARPLPCCHRHLHSPPYKRRNGLQRI